MDSEDLEPSDLIRNTFILIILTVSNFKIIFRICIIFKNAMFQNKKVNDLDILDLKNIPMSISLSNLPNRLRA